MNVKQLKDILARLPDSMEIAVQDPFESCYMDNSFYTSTYVWASVEDFWQGEFGEPAQLWIQCASRDIEECPLEASDKEYTKHRKAILDNFEKCETPDQLPFFTDNREYDKEPYETPELDLDPPPDKDLTKFEGALVALMTAAFETKTEMAEMMLRDKKKYNIPIDTIKRWALNLSINYDNMVNHVMRVYDG